jgi:hypothetical protein
MSPLNASRTGVLAGALALLLLPLLSLAPSATAHAGHCAGGAGGVIAGPGTVSTVSAGQSQYHFYSGSGVVTMRVQPVNGVVEFTKFRANDHCSVESVKTATVLSPATHQVTRDSYLEIRYVSGDGLTGTNVYRISVS